MKKTLLILAILRELRRIASPLPLTVEYDRNLHAAIFEDTLRFGGAQPEEKLERTLEFVSDAVWN